MRSGSSPTGLVLLTHGQIGQALVEVAEFILGRSLADIRVVSFRQSAAEKTGDAEIRQAIETANQGAGVLVLTDIGGASPCNFASRLLGVTDVAVISGLNLAMLIRAWNYRDQPLRRLADLAQEGAIRDIRES